MEVFERQASSASFRGATLVLCAPAIGNVGQLAVDLLIESTSASPAAVLETPHVLPVIGNDAFGPPPPSAALAALSLADAGPPAGRAPSRAPVTGPPTQGALCTTLELYAVSQPEAGGEGGCFLLQQRGPVVTGRQRAFAEEMVQWVRGAGFARVLILSSLDAALRQDSQIASAQVCYLDAAGGAERSAALAAAGVDKCSDEAFAGGKPLEERRSAPWPLFAACAAAGVPCVLLMAFASEGDNTGDALTLATAALACTPELASGANGTQQAFRPPPSWRYLLQAGA